MVEKKHGQILSRNIMKKHVTTFA